MELIQNDPLFSYAKQLLGEGKNIEEIKQLLTAKEGSTSLIEGVLICLKKEKRAIAFKTGKVKIGFAIALLISGFIISIIQYRSNHSFSIFLYGFTTVGTMMLFWGAYDIFN